MQIPSVGDKVKVLSGPVDCEYLGQCGTVTLVNLDWPFPIEVKFPDRNTEVFKPGEVEKL